MSMLANSQTRLSISPDHLPLNALKRHETAVTSNLLGTQDQYLKPDISITLKSFTLQST